jgi:hypothetical protein
MSWYKCFIAGENFPGAIIGESKPIGFYTTRYVEANNPEEAETRALTNLKNEQNLLPPPGVDRPNNAKVYFENIEEVERSEVNETNLGFSFFVMGT